MNDPILVPVITGVLVLFGILYMVMGWSSRRSMRFIVRGIGLILLSLGLWSIGWMQLAVNGVESLVAWFNRTVPTNALWVGAAAAVIGALMWIIGGWIKVPSREEARMAKSDRAMRQLDKDRRRTGASSASTASAPKASNNSGALNLDTQDPQMTQIMKKHGIDK